MAKSYLRMQAFSLYVNSTQGGRGGGRGDGEGWGPTPSVRYSNKTAARSLQRWNSRTNSWVEVSGHNLESS